jgi:phenylalanyl-tRNA synthetase alpha subunit
MKSGPETTSRMILKEAGQAKGSTYAKLDKKGNIGIEQIIGIAKKKMPKMNSYTLKNAVKEVAGACVPMGILCEGLIPKDFCAKVTKGDYDEEIKAEKTVISPEKKKELDAQLIKAQAELAGEFDAMKKKLEAKAAKEATKAAKAAPNAKAAPGAKPEAGAAKPAAEAKPAAAKK